MIDDARIHSARILAVDDEPLNLQLLEDMLTTAGFTQLRSCTNPHEGLEVCASWSPDLVLLDLHMPDLDGYGFMDSLGDGAPPILVLTADVTREAKVRAFSSGANDLVMKPFDSVDLVLRVRNLLETAFLQRDLAAANRTLEARAREATADLGEALLRFRSLVERLPGIVYRNELSGDARYVSPQVESILGYAPEQIEAEPDAWASHIHPDDLDTMLRETAAAMAAGGPIVCEYRMLAADGREVWLRDEAVVVFDDTGAPAHLLGIAYDVTDRKRDEATLRTAFERDARAVRRLREIADMKSTFLTAISHELRTPLGCITGFAELLLRKHADMPPEQIAGVVERLDYSAKRLDHLMADLIDVDRLARGTLEPRRQQVDVFELVGGVVASCSDDEHDVSIAGERVIAVVDPAQVERMAEHMIVNAQRYAPTGTRIRAEVRREPQGVLLIVDDEGPGVPDEDKERIFLPLTHGANVVEHSPGTGSGLALVARLAEIHGGRAWVESRPSGGCSFRVRLPDSGPKLREPR